jgi:MFS family permease
LRDVLGDIRGPAVWVVLACLICQMGVGFNYGLSPLAPDILAEFGWSRALYSSLQWPQGVVIAFASPLVGVLVALRGARAVLSISAIVLAVAYAAVAGMQAPWQLALAWGFIGLSVAGLGDITVGAVVAQWVARSRGLALGFAYTGSNIGGSLAALGAAELADARGWRVAVAAMAASALLVLLPAAWFGVRDRGETRQAAESAASEPPDVSALDLDVRAAVRTRSFWIIALGLFGFWIYLFAVLQHFVLSLVDAGMPRDQAAGHWARAVLMGMFSKITFGLLADRMPAKTGLLLDYGLLAISSLLLLGAPTGGSWLVWSFVLVFGFSYAARDVVTPLIVVRCFGAKNLAQIYGVLMLTILPGSLIGPVFTGWTHDETGSYDLAFLALAALNAATFALLFAVRDERLQVAAA